MPKRKHAETSPPPPEVEGHLTVHVYPDGIDRIYMWQATPAQGVASHKLYNQIFPALQAIDTTLKAGWEESATLLRQIFGEGLPGPAMKARR